jgi:hypothetical protein
MNTPFCARAKPNRHLTSLIGLLVLLALLMAPALSTASSLETAAVMAPLDIRNDAEMQAFADHYAPLAGNFGEINISLGPTGELRYPSYNKSDGWNYPDRGNFQASSLLAQQGFRDWALASFGGLDGVAARWGIPLTNPDEIRVPGSRLPDDSWRRAQTFVDDNDHVDTQYGRDFVDWYNQSLVDHGRRLLLAADETLVGAMEGVPLGAKLPGIHWQMMPCSSCPRIAEITAGYQGFVRDFRSSASIWYFRGTPNNWDTDEMERIDDSNVFRTCQTFSGVPNPRFKICHDKDWRECYPPEDHPASDGTHEIRFDADTHAITLSDGRTCGSLDTWYFRGTPNGWETTPMERVNDSDQFKITVDFVGEDPKPRFKIDHYGDWTESYPAQDVPVEDCSRYDISFDRASKAIEKQKIGAVIEGPCASGAIDIRATPPAGSYPTAQEVTLAAEPPGASLYYTTDGSIPTEQSQRYAGESIPARDLGPGVDLSLSVLAKADGLNDGQEGFDYRIGEESVPGQVVVSRFWHNHQPIYWPEWNSNGPQTNRVQYAWDSIVLKPDQTYDTNVGHPDNDLVEIFAKDDRRFAYQGRPRDSLTAIPSEGGFAMSYSGSLIDNVRNLAGNGQLGYGGDWWSGNREAKGWRTPSGSPRLDLVGFTYHHSLGAVLPKSVLRKEIQIFKQAWRKAWDGKADLSDHSRGFFPTEMAFSTPMIDVLADEGYEWVIVASHHLSRTCPTYLGRFDLASGDYGIKSSPPNRADLLGPSPTNGWWFGEPNPGNAAWNVAPFAYQLHRTKYVNPETGEEKTIIVVPSDDVMSYGYGYADEGISKIQEKIAPFATDPSRPALVMPATDGDNAWGGGFDSWMVATPKLFRDSRNAGYGITTVQDLVEKTPPPAGEYVHVEDGAWIFPVDDYGSPYFLKWVEPPLKLGSPKAYPGTMVDLESPGFALKFWSWAPVITGANWCETAEQIWHDEGGTVDAGKIQAPYDWANGSSTNANDIELAWHIYLTGLDSGFNYYGGLGNDDEVKPSLATRRAIEKLSGYLDGRLDKDHTPPSVFKPQRFPWNPGGYTFGWFNKTPEDGNYLKKMPSEFYIWTHVYDVSGVPDVTLKVRLDADGKNSLSSNQNETYAGGSEVGPWLSIPMTKRVLPRTREELNAAASNGEIDYFITLPVVADYYFAKITDEQVSGFRGKLLDYYIEATDSRGNTSRSDIQHVFVEDDGATPAPPQT